MARGARGGVGRPCTADFPRVRLRVALAVFGTLADWWGPSPVGRTDWPSWARGPTSDADVMGSMATVPEISLVNAHCCHAYLGKEEGVGISLVSPRPVPSMRSRGCWLHGRLPTAVFSGSRLTGVGLSWRRLQDSATGGESADPPADSGGGSPSWSLRGAQSAPMS